MIITTRARWIIGLALLMSLIGILQLQPFVIQLGVATLIWVFLEWIAFRYRSDFCMPLVTVRRDITDRQGPARVLWEGRPVEVRSSIHVARRDWLPSVVAHVCDLFSPLAEAAEQDNGTAFLLGAESSVEFSYQLTCHSVGTLDFMGVRLVLRDHHGFFQSEHFVKAEQSLRVLPLAIGAHTVTTTQKQNNALPPPGVHRISRAGVGSELLEIRDYVAGDSPRSIAWKVSARRDTLMSKQFESEVPVRCQLFVDTSPRIRLGYPAPSAANAIVTIAATVAQTLVANRDPVGLCMFGGQECNRATVIKPSANRRAALQLVDRLCSTMQAPVGPVQVGASHFLRPALDVARTRYPSELWQTRLFCRPWHLPATRMRIRLAAILTHHYRLGPFGMARLVEYDAELSNYAQRFLTQHHVPYVGPMHNERGLEVFDDRTKLDQVADLLMIAAARGRDNELFVVMADLLDTEYDLARMLRAIKVARARHHRVMLICAWPPGMPTKPPAKHVLDREESWSPETLATATSWQQKTTALQRLKGELGKLSVPIAVAAQQQAPLLILNQLELVRTARTVS